jgi:hypothetical protein
MTTKNKHSKGAKILILCLLWIDTLKYVHHSILTLHSGKIQGRTLILSIS